MIGDKSLRWLLAAAIVLFVVTRLILHLGLTPFFAYDTYKYLGAADARWAGQEWPPLFASGASNGRWLAVVGGVLHVMPGYAWFVMLAWGLSGGMTIVGVEFLQSVLALVAYCMTAHLVGQRLGRIAGLLTLLILFVSPTVAWLEHMVIPGGPAVSVVMIAVWIAANLPPRDERPWPGVLGALIAGGFVSFGILLRASSQAYVPIPAAVALLARKGWRSSVVWLLLYGVAVAGPLVPWMLHNHRIHGAYVLTANTGRNLYFSALWTNTVDRAESLRQLGIRRRPDVASSFVIADYQFKRLLDGGLTPIEADAAVLRMAMEGYRRTDLPTILTQRLRILIDLFASGDGRTGPRPFRAGKGWYLGNAYYGDRIRVGAEARYQHRLSNELVQAMQRDHRSSNAAGAFAEMWIDLLTFEGIPLLVAFILAVGVLLLRGPRHWALLLATAAPPLVFFATYSVFGAPNYRYQFQLHPWMQVTVFLALWSVGSALRGRWKAVRPAPRPVTSPPASAPGSKRRRRKRKR